MDDFGHRWTVAAVASARGTVWEEMADQESARPPSLARLFRELHLLHLKAGEPSVRGISRKCDGAISPSTVHNVLYMAKTPKWASLELVVEALGGSVEEFKQSWLEARTAQDGDGPCISGPADGEVDYLADSGTTDMTRQDPDRERTQDARHRAEQIIEEARREAKLIVDRAHREAAELAKAGELAEPTIAYGSRTSGGIVGTSAEDARAVDRLEPAEAQRRLASLPLLDATPILVNMSSTRAAAVLQLYPIDSVAVLIMTMTRQDCRRLLQRTPAGWTASVLDALAAGDAIEIMLSLPDTYAAKVLPTMEAYRVADFLTALRVESSVGHLVTLVDAMPTLAAKAISVMDPQIKASIVRRLPRQPMTEILLELDALDASRILAMIDTLTAVGQLVAMTPIEAGARLVAMSRAQAMECVSAFASIQDDPQKLARILEAIDPDDAVRLMLDMDRADSARYATVMDRAAVLRVLDAMGNSEAAKMIEAMRPSVAARVLTAAASDDAARRLAIVSPSTVVSILRAMPTAQAAERLAVMPRPRAAMLLEEFEPHFAATLLHELPVKVREECLAAVAPTTVRAINGVVQRATGDSRERPKANGLSEATDRHSTHPRHLKT